MKLTKQIKNQIREHALEESPRECCGFLVRGKEQNLMACRAQNSALHPNLFRCSPHDYLMAESKGKIVAVYHSHTNSNQSFSEFDKFNSLCHKVNYVLYCTDTNSFIQYDPTLSNFHKYIGRTFEIGKTDCYALIKDFYDEELGITLRDYERKEDWKSNLDKLFDSNFEREGFDEVDALEKYDCILFGFRKNTPSAHISVYLGDGLMLHQPDKSRSRVEEFSDRYKKFTKHIIRHKSTWKT
jgi:proteasome lid subunit RPN8/RPN11